MRCLRCVGVVLLIAVSTTACGAGGAQQSGGSETGASGGPSTRETDAGGTGGAEPGPRGVPDSSTPGGTSPGAAAGGPGQGESGPRAGRYVYVVDGTERPTEIRRIDRSTVRIPGPGSSYVIERWLPDGGYETEVSPGRGERCEWSPPLKRLPLPSPVGTTWVAKSSCASQDFQGEFEVVAVSTFPVEDRQIRTVRIAFTETRTLTYSEAPGLSTSTAPGTQTRTRFETEGEMEYSPDLSLQVRVSATTRSTGYGGGQSTSESRLIDLP